MSKKKQDPVQGTLSDKDATQILVDLLKIEGVSGEEHRIAKYVRERLLEAGAPAKALKADSAHRKSVFDGLTGNLVFRLAGRVEGPTRLLVAHLDTVPICRGARPVVQGGRIDSKDKNTGLGGDDRTGVAVLLTTALAILQSDLPNPPLTFLWTVQEEVGMYGARHVGPTMLGRPGLAFSWDGGAANSVRIGAIGCDRMAIDVRGIASHAGINPAGGVSAIAVASKAIADLLEGGWHGEIQKGNNRGTCNVGVIDGGESTNVVTDSVHVRLEARSHSATFRKRITREVVRAFERACRSLPNDQGVCATVEVNDRIDYEAFRLRKSDPSVKAAAAAVRAEGAEPEFVLSQGGLDANWITANGIPTVTLGCGQREVHTVDEWINLQDFHLARRVAMRLAVPVN